MSIGQAISRVKRHFEEHEPNTPRALLSEMLDDMGALCLAAIQEHERDVRADFDQWKHTSFGRRICQLVGHTAAYECFLAGRNWRPPTT